MIYIKSNLTSVTFIISHFKYRNQHNQMIIIVQFAINQYIFVNPRISFIFNFKNGNASLLATGRILRQQSEPPWQKIKFSMWVVHCLKQKRVLSSTGPRLLYIRWNAVNDGEFVIMLPAYTLMNVTCYNCVFHLELKNSRKIKKNN